MGLRTEALKNGRGYRLQGISPLVSPVGKGWRAMIYAPGSPSALPESPATLEKSLKEAIDARLNAQN
jgi:hypothetical protein